MIEPVAHYRSVLLGALAGLLVLGGCQKASPGTEPAAGATSPDKAPASADDKAAGKDDADHDGLHLKPEEIQKLGVATVTVQASTAAPEAAGFGVVLAHETLAQALADLRTASAVARQSQAAFERGRRLAGTAGALPVDTQEAAERQATVDGAALVLARQRLSSSFGQDAPWNGHGESALLEALANGTAKLVRTTFPVSTLTDTLPAGIRLGRIGAGQTARTWDSHTVWPAPADSTVPGRSFFTVVKGTAFGEGERLLAWTAVGAPEDGVLIPAAAALIAGGQYWCYIEASEGTYLRTEFDAGRPVSGGYFVTRGVDAGDKVVVKAAGQLLAKELNPSTDAE